MFVHDTADGGAGRPAGPAGPADLAGPAVEATGLRKVYGNGAAAVTALDGVDLTLDAGRFHVIMGASGSGKSTLLHCLAGLDRPTGGTVHIGGTDLTTLTDQRLTLLRRDHVGFVFQSFNLLPVLTAEENIRLPLTVAGRRPDKRWFDQIVAAVGLADRLGHRPSELSGGQQQRVAVARALITKPWVVFADEPTGNLDSHSGAEVLGLLRDAVDQLGQTVVMVTHDPHAAARADQVIFLRDGRYANALHRPTAEAVLDAMARLDPTAQPLPAVRSRPTAPPGPTAQPLPTTLPGTAVRPGLVDGLDQVGR